jgi:hypothetical protein
MATSGVVAGASAGNGWGCSCQNMPRKKTKPTQTASEMAVSVVRSMAKESSRLTGRSPYQGRQTFEMQKQSANKGVFKAPQAELRLIFH